MKKQKKSESGHDEVIKVSTLVYGILVLLIVAIGAASVLAYGTDTAVGARIAAKVSKAVPFPAAIVDWRKVVWLGSVQDNLESVQKFYRTQDLGKEGLRVDFTTADGMKRLEIKKRELLNKMIEDKAIEELANKNGIKFSSQDVDKAVSGKLEELGTAEEVKKSLADSYGWDLENFKKNVVLPSLYQDALRGVFVQEDTSAAQAKEKILQAQQQLKDGKDFGQVARNYSQGPSKDNGGELGWVKKDQVAPELQDALFSGKPLEKNGIIESSIGFHVVDVEDKKTENGEDVLRLRQIFAAKKTFADWLEEKMKSMRIMVPLKEFTWNKQDAVVDFRDPAMNQFEKDERGKVQGDASLMF